MELGISELTLYGRGEVKGSGPTKCQKEKWFAGGKSSDLVRSHARRVRILALMTIDAWHA